MRIKTRRNAPLWLIAALPILSIGVAFIIGAFFILWAGESPIRAYIALIKGSLGSTFAITESLSRATPLIFTGLACCSISSKILEYWCRGSTILWSYGGNACWYRND